MTRSGRINRREVLRKKGKQLKVVKGLDLQKSEDTILPPKSRRVINGDAKVVANGDQPDSDTSSTQDVKSLPVKIDKKLPAKPKKSDFIASKHKKSKAAQKKKKANGHSGTANLNGHAKVEKENILDEADESGKKVSVVRSPIQLRSRSNGHSELPEDIAAERVQLTSVRVVGTKRKGSHDQLDGESVPSKVTKPEENVTMELDTSGGSTAKSVKGRCIIL